jgi:hypothetical protein
MRPLLPEAAGKLWKRCAYRSLKCRAVLAFQCHQHLDTCMTNKFKLSKLSVLCALFVSASAFAQTSDRYANQNYQYTGTSETVRSVSPAGTIVQGKDSGLPTIERPMPHSSITNGRLASTTVTPVPPVVTPTVVVTTSTPPSPSFSYNMCSGADMYARYSDGSMTLVQVADPSCGAAPVLSSYTVCLGADMYNRFSDGSITLVQNAAPSCEPAPVVAATPSPAPVVAAAPVEPVVVAGPVVAVAVTPTPVPVSVAVAVSTLPEVVATAIPVVVTPVVPLPFVVPVATPFTAIPLPPTPAPLTPADICLALGMEWRDAGYDAGDLLGWQPTGVMSCQMPAKESHGSI